jgi:hypothetical protein
MGKWHGMRRRWLHCGLGVGCPMPDLQLHRRQLYVLIGAPDREKQQNPTQPRRNLMFKRCTIRLASIVLASAVCGHWGCSFTTINAAPGPNTALNDGASAQSALGSREKIADRGDFKVTYAPAKKLAEIAEAVNEMKALSDLIPDLNANFALAEDLPIVFKECDGRANASYDPKERKITICYEFIQYLANGFSKVYEKDKDVGEALVNAMTFFFFHELGHALFHIDGIPVGARQEDAADEFATFLMIRLGDDGELAALHAAVAFSRIIGLTDSLDSATLGDEHPLGKQRAFDVICWVYGKDPEDRQMRAAAKAAGLPESRLDRCGEEYQSMNNRWDELLEPHLKQDASTTPE